MNWLHFFWLTGETPPSLQILVNRMEQIYRNLVNNGRPEILSFRNQVHSVIQYFIQHLNIITINYVCIVIEKEKD